MNGEVSADDPRGPTMNGEVSADDPRDPMGHRRGVAAAISADDVWADEPTGGSALLLSPTTKNAHFDFAESGYSEGHFPRIQDFNSQGDVSLLDALSAYGGNAAAHSTTSLSRVSPRVSALLSRVYSYEQVLEEMVDTMMGGEDGNGAKDWVTVRDLVQTVPAVCGERGTWDRTGLHYACSNGAPLCGNSCERRRNSSPKFSPTGRRWPPPKPTTSAKSKRAWNL